MRNEFKTLLVEFTVIGLCFMAFLVLSQGSWLFR
jgi:hypothetical protein